ncbi:hypothetical protein PG993_008100 [Apiospora rasikravindrae]|uniref:Uncharacterized protein n=1 Tax=Apiospora rasikravindrae TaxID=990691 RepID=A0ABR1SZE1_9PEZI
MSDYILDFENIYLAAVYQDSPSEEFTNPDLGDDSSQFSGGFGVFGFTEPLAPQQNSPLPERYGGNAWFQGSSGTQWWSGQALQPTVVPLNITYPDERPSPPRPRMRPQTPQGFPETRAPSVLRRQRLPVGALGSCTDVISLPASRPSRNPTTSRDIPLQCMVRTMKTTNSTAALAAMPLRARTTIADITPETKASERAAPKLLGSYPLADPLCATAERLSALPRRICSMSLGAVRHTTAHQAVPGVLLDRRGTNHYVYTTKKVSCGRG